MVGRRTIKTWSSTQASISLSSGEAEFNGVVRGSGAGLGYRSLLRDLGHEVPLRVWTDSSAAIGICSRQGLGKLRHLDTHTLWVQQACRTGAVDLRKIPGESNPADLFTKHSHSREKLMELTKLFSAEFRGGRAENAAQVRKTKGDKDTMADADEEINAAEEHKDDEIFMPHLRYDEDTLNALYPKIDIPEAVDADDPLAEQDDPLTEVGYSEAKHIMAQAQDQGRRRKPRSDGPSSEVLMVEQRDEHRRKRHSCQARDNRYSFGCKYESRTQSVCGLSDFNRSRTFESFMQSVCDFGDSNRSRTSCSPPVINPWGSEKICIPIGRNHVQYYWSQPTLEGWTLM